MMIADLPFREVWAVDFEFSAPNGKRPKPICLVARELKTGRLVRQWEDEFGLLPPYSIGPDSLFVAFYASAEFGCHLALNWPMPERVLDLFAEHRCLTNGVPTGYGNSLLGALAYTDSMGLVPTKSRRCGHSRCAVAQGRVGSAATYSTIASPMPSL
jgi:hypothetical protein